MSDAPRVRAALVVIRGGRVLLAEHQKDGRSYYLFPGGGVDEGEAWDRAACREVREELGVGSRAGPVLALFENQAPGGGRRILHVFFRGEIDGEPAPTGEDPRVVGCRFLFAEELAGVTVYPPLEGRLERWLREGPPAGAEYGRLGWER